MDPLLTSCFHYSAHHKIIFTSLNDILWVLYFFMKFRQDIKLVNLVLSFAAQNAQNIRQPYNYTRFPQGFQKYK